ncbi:Lipase, putative [Hondaea fermentalgiana]|uniref:Lipase, putative n=1 Tax=Hondaea fermentalgiana TaxID=2315210 RepID=A0A2R5GGR1_9STRA|nr:Lipase, putative [Hondaea fermentalgiana]|eukprot:GBG30060.1 Lipase, putative [Hondaea fermentalgiana]
MLARRVVACGVAALPRAAVRAESSRASSRHANLLHLGSTTSFATTLASSFWSSSSPPPSSTSTSTSTSTSSGASLASKSRSGTPGSKVVASKSALLTLAAVSGGLALVATLYEQLREKSNGRSGPFLGPQLAMMAPSGGPEDEDEDDSKPNKDDLKGSTSGGGRFNSRWLSTIGKRVSDQMKNLFGRGPGGSEEDREDAKDREELQNKRKKERLGFLSRFNQGIKKGQEYISGQLEGANEFKEMASSVNSILSNGWTSKNKDEALEDIVTKAREAANAGSFQSNRSFTDMVKLFMDEKENIQESLQNAFGHIDLSKFNPTSLFYYLEAQDEKLNPSYKRRVHRFMFGASHDDVREIRSALQFADAAYFDTEEEITEMLEEAGYDMVFLSLESLPGKPAHFIAIKKGEGFFESTEVLIVVRGTKTIADLFTDAVLDPEEYKDGYAHAGIVRSARWLNNLHKELLTDISDQAKRQVNFKLIGHSLGAGIATISALEMKEAGFKNVEVVTFGCPALLSRDLSESCQDFVTSVVNDNDLIPRSSGATVGNLAMDILEFDYRERVKRDIRDAVKQLCWHVPFSIKESDVETFFEQADEQVEKHLGPSVAEKSSERAEVQLFPPGTCLHLYRDGMGVSCSYVPCDFFAEIAVQRTMIEDHLITGYDALISQLLEDHEA